MTETNSTTLRITISLLKALFVCLSVCLANDLPRWKLILETSSYTTLSVRLSFWLSGCLSCKIFGLKKWQSNNYTPINHKQTQLTTNLTPNFFINSFICLSVSPAVFLKIFSSKKVTIKQYIHLSTMNSHS